MENPTIEKKYVAADILRKRKSDQERVEQKVQSKIQKLQNKRKKKDKEHVPLEKFVVSYRKQRKAYEMYKKRNLKVERQEIDIKEDKVVMVVRIRGVKDISPEQEKILRRLRLRTLMACTFIRYNTQSAKMLHKVINYITFGYPNRKIISELIYKRCFGKIEQKRVQINTNKLVEDNLGQLGIICLEDIVEQIYSLGEQFDQIMKFIWPFKLSSPSKNFSIDNVVKPYEKGGEWGDRGEKINDLVACMI